MCSSEGCKGKLLARGMCRKHYSEWRRSQQTEKCLTEGCAKIARKRGLCDSCHGRKRVENMPVCTYPGCNRPQNTAGLCVACYNRKKRNGTPDRINSHGDAANDKNSSYGCWHQMITRCENPNNRNYQYYGGRGIKVCERWRNSFKDFAVDMGERPSRGHTLDRIENNGNYEPGNVRWATSGEQSKNKRNVVVTIGLVREIKTRHKNGERTYLIAREYGLNYQTVSSIVNGQSWKDVDPD